MQKALAETIRAAEMGEKPATLPATGKAQQENDDFMEQMRRQSLSNREKDIASKKLLTSAEMAQKLCLTTAALTAAVRAHRMFVLAGPSGENYYPAFFADKKYDRPVLEKVSKALGGVSGGSKWEFFTTPRFSLNGKSPLTPLQRETLKRF